MEFKIGDTVQLKSGGPIMTVEHIDEDNYASCVWFEKSDLKRNAFAAAVLSKASSGFAV